MECDVVLVYTLIFYIPPYDAISSKQKNVYYVHNLKIKNDNLQSF